VSVRVITAHAGGTTYLFKKSVASMEIFGNVPIGAAGDRSANW
jgi:hypothetical protein